MYVMWGAISSGSKSSPCISSPPSGRLRSSSSSMPGMLANCTSITWAIRAFPASASSMSR